MSAPHPLVTQLGAVRRERRIPAATLATRLGYSDMTLRNWFRGSRTPSLYALQDLADALGYTIALIPKDTHDRQPPMPAVRR